MDHSTALKQVVVITSRQRRNRMRAIAALGGALLALWTCLVDAADDPVHKYRWLSPDLHWSGGVVSWYYAPAGQPAWTGTTQMLNLVGQAMNAWSSQCGVQFAFLGITAQQANVHDGATIIGWVPSMTYSGNTSWYVRDGLMTEADIQLNTSTNGSAAAVYPMILHEIGHAIGLDHSEVANAVMAGPPASPAYSYATRLTPDDIAGCRTLYGGPRGASVQVDTPTWRAPPADASAAEYYHPVLDHYLVTADRDEKRLLARGGPDGHWRATGVTYAVWQSGSGDLQPMCRFRGNSSIDPLTGRRKGPNSDFYTADRDECAMLLQSGSAWVFVGDAFYVAVPAVDGACPDGTRPMYRYFRPEGDANHRYVSTAAMRAQMRARGWVDEGVSWCAGQ